MSRTCPCCGQPVRDVPDAEMLRDLQLGGVSRGILDSLIEAYPRAIHLDNIIERTYSLRLKDEPDTAWNTVQVLMVKMRPRLAALGWTIAPGPSKAGIYSLRRLTDG